MELQLANIDRVREIYKKQIQIFSDNPTPWIKWAELEKSLEEIDRFREIMEIAIKGNPNMNMPETIWKAYIDNEIDMQEYDNARVLYEKLLEKTQHLKVWVSYA